MEWGCYVQAVIFTAYPMKGNGTMQEAYLKQADGAVT